MPPTSPGRKTDPGWTPERVLRLRKALGMTQETFAQHCGVTFSSVNRWERGRKKVSVLAGLRLDAVLAEARANKVRQAI